MTLRDDLEKAVRALDIRNLRSVDREDLEYMIRVSQNVFRDHVPAMIKALRDAERMDQLELSQRADVYWHENGEQELAGYEWGCGGQYSTAREALDAAIEAARGEAKP